MGRSVTFLICHVGIYSPVYALFYRISLHWRNIVAVVEGIDPSKLAETGWGIIFPTDPEDKFVPIVKDALRPLLERRQTQAGDYFRIYEGSDGLRPGESKHDFLVRHGVPPADPANPSEMPYYLLLVGNPEQIPYRFQLQLDIQYAVGRIYFETAQEYANYASSIVAAETGIATRPKEITFFSVTHDDDPATTLTTTHFIEPLLAQLQATPSYWRFSKHMAQAASKAQLARLLGGDHTPALLVASSHGIALPPSYNQHRNDQGALLCQDWPGPSAWRGRGPIPKEYYFTGDDLLYDANLLGMIALFFASYSGGTPQNDDFPRPGTTLLNQVALKPFIARLPMRMLSQDKGGALAVIGQIERSWGSSFLWSRRTELIAVYQSTLHQLMQGKPVGSALEYFNSRYATYATELSTTLRDVQFGLQVEPLNISSMWTAHNDMRSFAIIGDPAVRLSLQETESDVPIPVPFKARQLDTPRPSNGINGETGHYEIEPLTWAQLSDIVRGLPELANLRELAYRSRGEAETLRGVREGIDPGKIAETGWGIIFSTTSDHVATATIKEALQPLLDLRRKQAGAFFHIFEGPDGVRPGESKTEFLVRHGVSPVDPADPHKIPYYLLLIGDPEQISYEFQKHLGMQYAVGRLSFATQQEYANYATNVVKSELHKPPIPQKAAFFSTAHENDDAMATVTSTLVRDIVDKLRCTYQKWQIIPHLRGHASKSQLAALCGGDQTPALLFAGAHGMFFSATNPRQRAEQGGLLCQQGHGLKQWQFNKPVTPEAYFAQADLPTTADLSGRIAFFFASYSIGTPIRYQFPPFSGANNTITARPFLAELPVRMLGLEKGALAVIGHSSMFGDPGCRVYKQVPCKTFLLQRWVVLCKASPWDLR